MAEFLKIKGKNTGFVLATDTGRTTSDAYMKAFDVDSIPHAFVVNKQREIAWHGHPKDGLKTALEEIVAGTYDLQKMVRREKQKNCCLSTTTWQPRRVKRIWRGRWEKRLKSMLKMMLRC